MALPECPVCGKKMAALEWEGVGTTHKATTYKFIKFMVYACPHCDTYYDASLQPLANDEATLARGETKGIMRKIQKRSKNPHAL
jgi:sarcosine oxidase delta subunit